MVWQNHWFPQIGAAKIINLSTDQLEEALSNGEVDAVVSWDPWIAQWKKEHPNWQIVQQRNFRSVLVVGKMWALGGKNGSPRAKRLVQMLEEAMQIAAAERAQYDQEAAKLGDWSIDVVVEVSNQNEQLQGEKKDISLIKEDREHIRESMKFVDGKRTHVDMLFGEYLLDGELPEPRKK